MVDMNCGDVTLMIEDPNLRQARPDIRERDMPAFAMVFGVSLLETCRRVSWENKC